MAIDLTDIEQNINLTTTYSVGTNGFMASDECFEIKMDVGTLARRTVEYFKIHYKKIEIESFYDKPFLDRMKIIIKNEEKFKDYLSFVGLNLVDFIHCGVYIFPQCFSSSIIKLLREKIAAPSNKKVNNKSKKKKNKK